MSENVLATIIGVVGLVLTTLIKGFFDLYGIKYEHKLKLGTSETKPKEVIVSRDSSRLFHISRPRWFYIPSSRRFDIVINLIGLISFIVTILSIVARLAVLSEEVETSSLIWLVIMLFLASVYLTAPVWQRLVDRKNKDLAMTYEVLSRFSDVYRAETKLSTMMVERMAEKNILIYESTDEFQAYRNNVEDFIKASDRFIEALEGLELAELEQYIEELRQKIEQVQKQLPEAAEVVQKYEHAVKENSTCSIVNKP